VRRKTFKRKSRLVNLEGQNGRSSSPGGNRMGKKGISYRFPRGGSSEGFESAGKEKASDKNTKENEPERLQGVKEDTGRPHGLKTVV